MPKKIRTSSLKVMKQEGQKIVALTAYDFGAACALEAAGVEIALVGDSLGMVVLGYDSTLPVTLEEMIHHSRAVRRGLKHALLVVDLPFMSYQLSPQQALESSGRLLKEAGAEAVKLEGGLEIVETVRHLRQAGIAVMGHLGLTPQSVHALGGYKRQGTNEKDAEALLKAALALEEAGAFAIVLEVIPPELAAKVSKSLSIPTIGIGSGPHCDGQVLVLHDALGMLPKELGVPAHAKAFANLYEQGLKGVQDYVREVKDGHFPS